MKKLERIKTFFLKSENVRNVRFWYKLLHFKLTSRPLVYWYSRVSLEGEILENFGDIVTPYIVKKLAGVSPVLFKPTYEFSLFCKHYIMIGSIIGDSRNK